MRIYFFMAFVFLGLNTTAQKTQIPLINSAETIQKGIELSNENKKDEALLEFSKVSKSDTNYALAVYHKTLTLLGKEEYDQSIEAAKLGLGLNSKYEAMFYLFLGAAYQDAGQKELALQTYQKGIDKYPYDYNLYANKGMAYYELWKINEAVECFQKAINLNFYNALSHRLLGYLCLMQNQPTRGALSILTYLTIEPQDERAQSMIVALEKHLTTNVPYHADSLIINVNDDFQTTDLVLNAQATFNKNFKLKSEHDFKVIRQCQALLEKLEYVADSDDFWMKNYVPFYNKIWQNGLFNDFTSYWMASVNEKALKKYEKNDAGIKKAKELAESTFSEINKYKTFTFNGITGKYYVGTYNDNSIQAITTKYDRTTEKISGYTEFYHENKALMSKGLYDDNGEKTGEWKYFTEQGLISQICVYSPKDSSLTYKNYYPNGNVESEGTYKNETDHGKYFYYYPSGGKKFEKVFENGKKAGKGIDYHQNGKISSEGVYKDDQLEGLSSQYYYNGKTLSQTTWISGEEEGEYKGFHPNGQLKTVGKMSKDLSQGEWLYYDDKGKLTGKSNYKDSKLEGTLLQYNHNGKVSFEGNYQNGEPTGFQKYFDEDGKLFGEEFFEKKTVKYSKFYDKKGALIKENTRKGEQFVYVSYFPTGQKRIEGSMNKLGNNGTIREYYMSGALLAERQYKDGSLHGISKEYTELGKLKAQENYSDGLKDGYFTYYHDNAKIATEGWYVKDKMEGEWRYYYDNGNLKDIIFYQKDEAIAYSENYAATGKKLYEYYKKDGIYQKITQYDTLGNVLNVIENPTGNGKISILSFNKKPYKEYTLENGVKKGKEYYYWAKDGKPNAEIDYNNDLVDGLYKGYHPDGSIKYQYEYLNNQQHGIQKRFYENGKLEFEAEYVNDVAEGESRWYNYQGILETIIPMSNDQKHGELIQFGEDGKTAAYKIIYIHNHIEGYSYLDKNGQWLPTIKTENGTFDIKAYYPNGKLSYQASYLKNQRIGNSKRYYLNGNLSSDYNYVDGLYDGEQKEYFTNGKIRIKYYQKDDQTEGPYYYYNENGKKTLEENYLQGHYHGKVIEYDANEKATKTRNFYFGMEY